MSLLDITTLGRPGPSTSTEFEDAFLAWAEDPSKPDVIGIAGYGDVSMADLARRLDGSPSLLPPTACRQLGVPTGVTVGIAAAELLHVTVDPDGPRCRSFRAATYYLRGLIRLDDDLTPVTSHRGLTTVSTPGHDDVR